MLKDTNRRGGSWLVRLALAATAIAGGALVWPLISNIADTPQLSQITVAPPAPPTVRTLPSLGVATQANAREVPPSRAAVQYSYAPIVASATPAVVNVYVSSTTQVARSPFADDPFFSRFFGERFGGGRERMQQSLGSGVIVSPDGVIVTNTHVIKLRGKTEISIALADNREFKARVLMQDEKTDIAVVKIENLDGETFPFLEFENSDRLQVGDLVLAIGNPFGVGQTVTSGIVSGLARTGITQSDAVFVQTDAAINPGNSGGALIDMAGRLVGINTAIFSRSGGSNGIGFAIPSNLVRLYTESAIAGRKVAQPWIGARLEPVTRQLARDLNLERVAGALISRIYTGGPADKAGLEPGDVVTSVDGTTVADALGVIYRLTTKGVDVASKLTVIRNGKTVDIDIAPTATPELGAGDVRNLSGYHPFDGARVANVLPHIAEEMELDTTEGVVVLSVQPRSTANRIGLRAGDIVLQIGRAKIADLADLERVLGTRQDVWALTLDRGGRVVQFRVRG